MNWREEFPPTYDVPSRICALITEDRVLEDTSSRADPCPSFAARLRNKKWIRLWVEHANPAARKGWPDRFTIMVQPRPNMLLGQRLFATEDVEAARRYVLSFVRSLRRFRRAGKA